MINLCYQIWIRPGLKLNATHHQQQCQNKLKNTHFQKHFFTCVYPLQFSFLPVAAKEANPGPTQLNVYLHALHQHIPLLTMVAT
jgi:hypothetical protein